MCPRVHHETVENHSGGCRFWDRHPVNGGIEGVPKAVDDLSAARFLIRVQHLRTARKGFNIAVRGHRYFSLLVQFLEKGLKNRVVKLNRKCTELKGPPVENSNGAFGLLSNKFGMDSKV
jgi:hypothetical protein